MNAPRWFAAALGALTLPCSALDQNGNLQSDIWELVYSASGLPAAGDPDGDGWSNELESAAGTNPRDGASFPGLKLDGNGSVLIASWQGLAGKKYTLLSRETFDAGIWEPLGGDVIGTGGPAQLQLAIGSVPAGYFRLRATDQDSDGDTFTDWEERAIGFDPMRTRTERNAQLDSARIVPALTAANTITVSVYDDTCSERWPDPAVFAVRRTGGVQPLTVNVAFGGSAASDTDYAASIAGNVVTFPPGVREVFVEIAPIVDAIDGEPTESVTLTALAGSGYAVGAQNAGIVSLINETAASGPSAKEAARFLIQAAFGPDQDSADDADQIPENVEEVMSLGFSAWIDAQLARPVGTLQPFVQWAKAQPSSAELYNDQKQNAWWGRAMGLRKLRPDAVVEQDPDPLRQRVGFALSQIFVISDRMEDLAVDPEGMANFYDTLLTHSFGNFEDLLRAVALHPCMGLYLSHLGNRKADPIAHTFPDENFAREIMQLFSIGLWMLNPDGTRQLDAQDQPIPTYNNANITEFARVFTGLAFGNNTAFGLHPRDFRMPMKGWDAEHDLAPKTLLLGVTTPQRIASPGNAGTTTLADVNAAVNCLFNHPNVGPFIGRQLIQRLVTSNPSPAYIERVSAAFNAAPRGDLGRTVKAILLDPEARDGAMMSDPTYGKLREPFLKTVNFARAFNASTPSGWYYLDAFILDHSEEPMKAPSVFNYYLPTYSPPGVLAQSGLVAPEFQIVNAASGVTAPNYFWNSATGGLHRWGVGRADYNTTLNVDQEMLMNVPAAAVNDPYPNTPALDPDPLIRRLDLALTGGTLEPRTFQIIREALARIGPGSQWEWPKSRLKLAIYLIVTSPEFAVQH